MPEALGHPNAPGWAQTIGTVGALLVTLAAVRFQARLTSAEKRRDRENIRTFAQHTAIALIATLSKLVAALQPGDFPKRDLDIYIARIESYCDALRPINVIALPNARVLQLIDGILSSCGLVMEHLRNVRESTCEVTPDEATEAVHAAINAIIGYTAALNACDLE